MPKPNIKKIETLTIRQSIEHINRTIRSKLPNKDADTVRIMEYVAELNETGILQSFEKRLTPKQTARLHSTIKRLQKDEPLEYITGIADFHGRRFYVTRDTLIPRVETETLVDFVIGYAQEKTYSARLTSDNPKKKQTPINIVDVGTGSGCIIISTALCLRGLFRYFATDISTKAVAVARRNVRTYSLGRSIHLYHGNLLDPIGPTVTFDIVAANLPYIKKAQMTELAPSVKNFEPHLALDGGINGASLIRELLIQTVDRINPKGVIVLEAQPEVIETVNEFARRFYEKAHIYTAPDTFGVNRYVIVEC